ncbi:hypothetical protein VP1G_03451 [Cytospora mali]|uniref:Uncharacterized protein n=1 Tax=Cytospora mali TaxID=578113 RepID=A0A194UWT8_CYTMA|nr:hypothetical protein VP1G_03451 [Valsa mali var. pyri (nom. inval.)]
MDALKRHGRPRSGSTITSANPQTGRPSTNTSNTSRTSLSNASNHTATSSSSRIYPQSNSSTTEDGEFPAPNDIWPRSESDDSNDDVEVGTATLDRNSISKRSGFFRSLVQKISKKTYYKPQRNPRSAVLGIDLEPVDPPYLVSNCHFQVRDATDEWNLNTMFDFVHVRMLGDVPEKERLIQSIYDNLNPGGWAEFTEWIVVLHSPNHSLDNTCFEKWNQLIRQGKCFFQPPTSITNSDCLGLKDLGSSLYYPTQYKPLLQKVGFENITETKNGAPTNACYPGKKLRKIGNMMTQNWIAILEPLTSPVLTNGLGWTPEDVKTLLASDDGLLSKAATQDGVYGSFVITKYTYSRVFTEGVD